MRCQSPSRLLPAAIALVGMVLVALAIDGAFAQRRRLGGLMPAAPAAKAAPAAAATADDAADEEDKRIEERFPGGAALKTDPEQARLLKRAEQCVEDGRLDLAAVLWQKVLDEAGDTLMVSRSQPRAQGSTPLLVYSSLSDEVERTLGKLPKEALDTYRIAADGEAQAVIAAAGPEKEEEALAAVVRRFFLSSQGDDAAYKLACLALDRHDFVGASRLLSRILERHPDPSMPRGDLLLRLAVASAHMGDKANADAALAQLASVPGVRPPSELVDLVRQDIGQVAALASASHAATGKDWHMALGNASRGGHMASLPSEATNRTLTELWVQEYPLALSGQNAANPYGAMGMGGMGGMVVFSGRMPAQPSQPQALSREDLVAQWRQNAWRPTPQLLFDGGRVYVKSPDRLLSFRTDALGDQPVWRSLWRNQFELDGLSHWQAMMAMNMGHNQQLQPSGKPKTPAEIMLFGDRVHQAMSIAGGVIYSLEGKAISESGGQPPAAGKPFQWGVTPRRTRTNWLTAYSAAGGKMKWTRTASDEDKEGTTDVGFLAAPVPCGNLLLAPVTDGGTIWLFGISADDGKTVWKSYLCDEPQGGASAWSPVAMAVDGREAYLTVGCGVIFAVDGVGGTVRWAIRYQRDGKSNQLMRNYGYATATLDLSGWDDDLVIPYGRALIVMSSDSDKLLAIDRRTGGLLWDSPRTPPTLGPAASYCLGVNGRGLFVAGKNILRRYDIVSGLLRWEKEIDDSFGRGCVTADAVYLPVKDSIVTFDAATGRELGQVGVALTSDDPVGNLFSDGDKLWVVGAGRVYAMTTLEHRLKRLAEQIAAGEPEAQLNRMRLFFKQNDKAAALDDLRGAYVLFQQKQSPDEAAQRLFAAMNELKLPQNEPLTALRLVRESFVTAASRPQLAKEAAAKRAEVMGAAINALRQDRVAGAAAAVLSVASLIDDDYLTQAATAAIDMTATKDDVAALLRSLAEGNPAGQMMSIRALARLARDDAKEPLRKASAAGDDRVRLAAARALANAGDREVLGTFVVLLESPSVRVRTRSHQSLRALTGQKIDFAPEGKPEDRAKTVAAWQQWISTSGQTAQLTLPLTEQAVLLGRTLYVSQQQTTMVELDHEFKKRWEVQLPGPAWGCQGLPNGHRLVAVFSQSMVIEYDADGKEVWRKEGLPGPPYSVQRLESGATLVACGDIHQVVEIAPDGTTSAINVQGRPMSAQRLENGNTLCALQNGNRVVEIDRAGKIVWELRTGNGPASAQRLENGNTLVCLLTSRQVVEYDPTGKNIVWRSGGRLANPLCAQRLPSGSTLVADFQGLHEFDPTGKQDRMILRQPNLAGVSSF